MSLNPRYGFVVGGSVGGWPPGYAGMPFYVHTPVAPNVANHEYRMLASQDDLSYAASQAAENPGGAWLLGNEPQVADQDTLSPAAYLAFWQRAAAAILAADPAAKLIAGQTLNWNLIGSTGIQSGGAFMDAVVAAAGGTLPPCHGLGLHLYDLDYRQMPPCNPQALWADVVSCRAWLTAHGLAVPIYVTELGAITDVDTAGQRQPARVLGYLNALCGWLGEHAAALNVACWCAFATGRGVFRLMTDDGALTPVGAQYLAWASGQMETAEMMTIATLVQPWALPPYVLTALPFEGASRDEMAGWQATAPTRITVPTSGDYDVRAALQLANNPSGARQLRIRVNGAGSIDPIEARPATVGDSTAMVLPWIVRLQAGDSLELIGYQASGVPLSVERAELLVRRLGG
jgi:hypothetical protein